MAHSFLYLDPSPAPQKAEPRPVGPQRLITKLFRAPDQSQMTDGFESFDQSVDHGAQGIAASSPSLTESAPYATAQNTQCHTLARSQLKEKSLPTEAPLYLSAMDGDEC